MRNKPTYKKIAIFIIFAAIFYFVSHGKFLTEVNSINNLPVECYRCNPYIDLNQDAYFSTYGSFNRITNNVNRNSFIGYNLQNYPVKFEDVSSYHDYFKSIVSKKYNLQEVNLSNLNTFGLTKSRLDSVGIVRQNMLLLRFVSETNYADQSIDLSFVSNVNQYISGDWNGDGIDTIGIFNSNAQFILVDDYSNQTNNLSFVYGNPGWIPIAGDWNGNNIDTIGLYDPSTSTFYLRNSNSSGFADTTFNFMSPNQNFVPIAGDWDGDGKDSIGIFDRTNKVFYLKNSNQQGDPDISFQFGEVNKNYRVITGDWKGLGFDSVGLWDLSNGEFILKNFNDNSNSYSSFFFGDPAGLDLNSVVVSGTWINLDHFNFGFGNVSTMKSTKPDQLPFLNLSSVLPQPINDSIIGTIDSSVNFMGNLLCDVNSLIFVNGDINFYVYNFVSKSISTSCSFISKGKITINSPISNVEPATTLPRYNQISALLLSDQGIDINLETPPTLEQFNVLDARGIIIRGALISKKDIKFFGRLDNEPNQNSLRPAFVVEYDPRFREFLRNVIGYKKYRILE